MTVELTEATPGVLWITLNDPAKRNALTVKTMAELSAGLERLAGDDGLRVGVLTGAGNVFCAGGDTSRMGEQRPTPWERRSYLDGGVGRLSRHLLHLDKPLIAAVNGPAVGAGVDLALWCDFRFAAPGAYLRAGFVDLGLVPGFGSAWHLARLVGYSRALEVLLTGEEISAAQALEMGLYRTVADDFRQQAASLATTLAAKPNPAVRATKRLVQRALATDVVDNLELAWSLFGLVQETPEHAAAIERIRNRKR